MRLKACAASVVAAVLTGCAGAAEMRPAGKADVVEVFGKAMVIPDPTKLPGYGYYEEQLAEAGVKPNLLDLKMAALSDTVHRAVADHFAPVLPPTSPDEIAEWCESNSSSLGLGERDLGRLAEEQLRFFESILAAKDHPEASVAPPHIDKKAWEGYLQAWADKALLAARIKEIRQQPPSIALWGPSAVESLTTHKLVLLVYGANALEVPAEEIQREQLSRVNEGQRKKPDAVVAWELRNDKAYGLFHRYLTAEVEKGANIIIRDAELRRLLLRHLSGQEHDGGQ